MLSRSAMVKLKAIFIIDLIIVGAAAGAFFYLQNARYDSTGSQTSQVYTARSKY